MSRSNWSTPQHALNAKSQISSNILSKIKHGSKFAPAGTTIGARQHSYRLDPAKSKPEYFASGRPSTFIQFSYWNLLDNITNSNLSELHFVQICLSLIRSSV